MTDTEKTASLHSPADRGARATDEKAAAANQEAMPRSGGTIPPEQLVTPPTDAPFVGGKQVAVVIGPYRGSILTMPAAEADQAIADHWAAEQPTAPFDADAARDHPPLSDAERASAEAAAQAWADKVNQPPEPPEPPVEGRTKSMEAERGTYETRTAAAPKPATTSTSKK